MRFSFNNQQLAYLDQKMGQLALAVKQPEFAEARGQKFYRTVCKMKYKFTPNALVVFLGEGERNVVFQMLEYRMSMLAQAALPSDEMTIVQSLLDVMSTNGASS